MIRLFLLVFVLTAGFQDPQAAKRADLAGDALPDGAVCRLGTRRWRTPGRVWSLAFPKDNRTLLVGAGTSLLLWDVEKNQRIRAFQGHRGVVGSIAVLPDGGRALSAGGDGRMILWNLETGARIRDFEGHQERVWTVTLSKDGATALSAGMDGTLGLWNVETGERLRTLKGHQGAAMAASFVSDGARIVSGGIDGRLILWDAATGDKLKSVEAHKGPISNLAISPDGRTAVTTSGLMIPGEGPEPAEGSMAVWDLERGRRTRLITGPAGFLWVAFAADGRSVIAGSADRSAARWDVETGARIQSFEGLGDRTHPLAMRDGLLAIGDGTAVSLFDAATGKRTFAVPGHTDGVGGVGFLPDGRAVTAGADGWISIWDAATGARLRAIDTGALEFGALALSPDGARALSGGWRVPAALWNLQSGECLQRYNCQSARGLAFGAGLVVTGLLDGRLILWDPETGTPQREFTASPTGAVAVRPDGKLAMIPAAPKSVKVLDFTTGRPVRTLEGHGDAVPGLAFSPDGTASATGSTDGLVIIRDGDAENERRRIETGAGVRTLSFGPKGLLAAGHTNGTITIWDTESGKKLASYRGHQGGVTSVAIDSTGRRAISGSGDTTAIVWEIPAQ